VTATITGRCDSRARPADQYCAEFVQNAATASGGAIHASGYGLSLRGYAFARYTSGNLGTIIAQETTPTSNADLRKVRIENTLFESHAGVPIIFYPAGAETDLTLRHVTASPPSGGLNAVLIGFAQQIPIVSMFANVLPANALTGIPCNVAYEDALLTTIARGSHRPSATVSSRRRSMRERDRGARPRRPSAYRAGRHWRLRIPARNAARCLRTT
jgi:hypothetical protein